MATARKYEEKEDLNKKYTGGYMSLTIRPETPSDYPAVTEVNDLAFGQPAEGKLVEI